MKLHYCCLIFSIFLFVSCKKTTKKTQEEIENKKIVLAKENAINKQRAVIYEHKLSLYNKKYLLKVTPKLDKNNSIDNFEIKLNQQNSTIFNKLVNIDTLGLKTKAVVIAKELPKSLDIAKEYIIKKIIYHDFRANNIYFQATLTPKTKGKDVLKALFYIQYLYQKNTGKLTVQAINKKGFGQNKGELTREFNLKKVLLTKEEKKERKDLVTKLKNMLSANNYTKEIYSIRNDSLIIKRKISVKGVRQYNFLKFPLQRLLRVSSNVSDNTLTLYADTKCIEVIRFKQRNTLTSQVTLKSTFNNFKTKELLKMFIKIKGFNEEQIKIIKI